MLSFFPRGVLDETLNLIGSVSEDFPSYSCPCNFSYSFRLIILKLYMCFKDGLKICMCFFQNSEIIFYYFFGIFNLDFLEP